MGEIPMKQGCNNVIHVKTENLFNNECKECGSIFGYADDSTYISTDNKLNINTAKTTLIEIMLHQKKAKIKGTPHTRYY